ncbi:hypothetical protein [Nostoc sp. NIES-3756]|uniref:hypothetical protein n=1 Tax=Nostoc sp. NIES-3756 TaxID=1751286 RepID=UPI0008374179|nr:hypothetical protein [Nostoc sp. NIES-3756]
MRRSVGIAPLILALANSSAAIFLLIPRMRLLLNRAPQVWGVRVIRALYKFGLIKDASPKNHLFYIAEP